VICIDTNVLIWGVQGVARPNQLGMIDRTRRYLAHLTREHEQVMVPVVVVGEYLHGFPQDDRDEQLQALSRMFFLPAYDARCAALAAELESVGQAVRGEPGARVAFRADAQIIATAICHGATQIVTGNVTEFRRIAGTRIPVIEVPVIPEQGNLLAAGEQPEPGPQQA
jgi:predicted nucleic acid-binding protein